MGKARGRGAAVRRRGGRGGGTSGKRPGSAPSDDLPLRVALRTSLARAHLLAPRPAEFLQACQRAVADADELGEPSALLHPLATIASARGWPELLQARLSAGSRAVSIVRDGGTGSDKADADIEIRHLIDLVGHGDIAAARAEVDIVKRRADTVGNEPLRQRAWCIGVMLEMSRDLGPATARAVEAAQESADLGAPPSPAMLQLVFLRREQGRLGALSQEIEGRNDPVGTSVARSAVLALVACENGHLVQAREAFEKMATAGFDKVPRDGLWMVTLAILAELCAYVGDVVRANAIRQLLETSSGQTVVGEGLCLGPADRYLGLLAGARHDWHAAEEALEAALRLRSAWDQPVWATRVQLTSHGHS